MMKSMIFASPYDLTTWVNDNTITANNIVQIVCDNSGKYILFYMEA